MPQLIYPSNPFIEFPLAEIETSIPARLEKQVALYPQQIAIKTAHASITYEALNRLANQIARTILAHSDNAAQPVGLLFNPGIPLIAAMCGVLKAGHSWVPLDPTYPQARLTYMLEDSQTALILTHNQNEAFAHEFTASERQVINIDQIEPTVSTENLNLTIPADTIANLIYTSGSTGQPKGVVYSHRTVLHNIMGHTKALHISAADRLSLFSSFSHLAGMSGIFRALLNGATTFPYNLKKEGLLEVAAWLIKERITIYHSVPTVFRHFVDTLTGEESFPDLRFIHIGGEPVSRQDIELFKRHFSDDCLIMNNLGSTETGTTAYFFMNKQTQLEGNLVPVGYPAEGREILLLDETGQAVELGQEGLIVVKSDYLPLGYWNRPDLTAAAFRPVPNSSQRIYRTGDLGRFLPDGRLLHLGRKDSQVKIRGQRIELGEIEAALMSHPQVKELAVVARDDKMEDKHLVAYVVPQPEAVLGINELREFLFEQLLEAMVPSTFVFMEALPLLPNGKINRLALPEVDQMRPALQSNFIAPRDALEEHLAELWEIVLGIQPIGVRDNFFDLGGHSLASSQLLSQINKLYKRELPLSALFQSPTIEQLADLLRREDDTTHWVSLIPLQPQGSNPPFFCLPGNLGNVFTDLHYLLHYMGQEQPVYGLQDGVEAPSKVEALAAHYLKEIKAKQPEGPYFLGGICAGGVVAFEMARQLQSVGQNVSLLALIEPAPPRGPSLRSYMGFARTVLRRVTRRLGHHSSTLTRLDSAEQKDFTRLKGKLIAKSWALRQYAPQPYPGKLHLFLAEETIKSAKNPRFDWGKFAAEGTAIHEIPGNHDSVTGDNDTKIDEQGMKVLAKKLQTCIDEALVNNNK